MKGVQPLLAKDVVVGAVCNLFDQGQQHSLAMIRAATGLRRMNARVVARAADCLLIQQLQSSLSFTSSTVALRERVKNSSFTDKHRNPTSAPLLDVSAGGGPRPKTPRIWKTKTRKGSIAKSEKLVELVDKLSNTKEEVYGVLDAWIAWDLEFPLIPVKKALKQLRDRRDWRRIIQVSKWMLEKGQGKTLATYSMLLEALDHEGRIDEAEDLWEMVLAANMECIPRSMFGLVISMYNRHGKKKQLLKVFADMEELLVRPDFDTVNIVARTYTEYGYQEYGESLLKKYPPMSSQRGRRSKFKGRPAANKANKEEAVEADEEDAVEADEDDALGAEENAVELNEGPILETVDIAEKVGESSSSGSENILQQQSF